MAAEHVVKCLVFYHPDDDDRHAARERGADPSLYEAVQASGHELLLEIIPPKSLPREPDTVLRAVKRLYNLGIYPEWWKLEPMAPAQWRALDALIAERDPVLPRRGAAGALGAGRDARSAASATRRRAATCRGFAVGRTIFHDPARAWLAGEIDDAALKARVRATYERLIDAWRAARAPGRAAA